MTKPNTRNNKDKHKGDKPEPELDQSTKLDDSRDLEQTDQSMELEETVQEDMEPDIQIRLRDSEQENTITDLDTSQENLSTQPNEQEEQEQRNTKPEPEPEPEIETPIPTTSQGKRSTKRVNYSLLHTGKKTPKTPKNKELKDTIDDLKKQLKEAKKTNKQNDKALTLKYKIINNLEEKLEIKDQQIHHLNQDIDQNKQEEETLSTQNDELHNENEDLQNKIKQLENENKELKQHNDELKRRLNTLTAKNQDKRIMIIGDSNTRHITDQLFNMTSHDIQHLHAFTLEQALDLIPTISEDQMTDTRVYLLVGTNNIKRGETARECADKHKEITDMIVEKAQNVTVIQLPPIYSRDQRKQRELDRQIIKLNTILEERHPNNIISTQFMELNRQLIDQDGIHLTTQAARDQQETKATWTDQGKTKGQESEKKQPNNHYHGQCKRHQKQS